MRVFLLFIFLFTCGTAFGNTTEVVLTSESYIVMYSRIVKEFNSQNYIDTISDSKVFLLLPINDYTESIELVLAISYEKNEEYTRAKIEYTSFISNHPNSTKKPLVQNKLDKLREEHPDEVSNRSEETRDMLGEDLKVNGFVSVYYTKKYQVNTKSSIMYRNGEHQSKIVDKLSNTHGVLSLYYEYLNLTNKNLFRIGKQDTRFLGRANSIRVDGYNFSITHSESNDNSVSYEKVLNIDLVSSILNMYYSKLNQHRLVGFLYDFSTPLMYIRTGYEVNKHSLLNSVFNVSVPIKSLNITYLYNRRQYNINELVGFNYNLNEQWNIYTDYQLFNGKQSNSVSIINRGKYATISLFINNNYCNILSSFLYNSIKLDVSVSKNTVSAKSNVAIDNNSSIEIQYDYLGSNYVGYQLNF